MSATQMLTKEQAAVITAYTGTLCGELDDFLAYASKRMGGSVSTLEMVSADWWVMLKTLARDDFLEIAHRNPSKAAP